MGIFYIDFVPDGSYKNSIDENTQGMQALHGGIGYGKYAGVSYSGNGTWEYHKCVSSVPGTIHLSDSLSSGTLTISRVSQGQSYLSSSKRSHDDDRDMTISADLTHFQSSTLYGNNTYNDKDLGPLYWYRAGDYLIPHLYKYDKYFNTNYSKGSGNKQKLTFSKPTPFLGYAVLDNKIFLAPNAMDSIYVLDKSNHSVIDKIKVNTPGYCSVVIGKGNLLYFVPSISDEIIKMNPYTHKTSVIGKVKVLSDNSKIDPKKGVKFGGSARYFLTLNELYFRFRKKNKIGFYTNTIYQTRSDYVSRSALVHAFYSSLGSGGELGGYEPLFFWLDIMRMYYNGEEIDVESLLPDEMVDTVTGIEYTKAEFLERFPVKSKVIVRDPFIEHSGAELRAFYSTSDEKNKLINLDQRRRDRCIALANTGNVEYYLDTPRDDVDRIIYNVPRTAYSVNENVNFNTENVNVSFDDKITAHVLFLYEFVFSEGIVMIPGKNDKMVLINEDDKIIEGRTKISSEFDIKTNKKDIPNSRFMGACTSALESKIHLTPFNYDKFVMYDVLTDKFIYSPERITSTTSGISPWLLNDDKKKPGIYHKPVAIAAGCAIGNADSGCAHVVYCPHNSLVHMVEDVDRTLLNIGFMHTNSGCTDHLSISRCQYAATGSIRELNEYWRKCQ